MHVCVSIIILAMGCFISVLYKITKYFNP